MFRAVLVDVRVGQPIGCRPSSSRLLLQLAIHDQLNAFVERLKKQMRLRSRSIPGSGRS
jgi:hypothetical protein